MYNIAFLNYAQKFDLARPISISNFGEICLCFTDSARLSSKVERIIFIFAIKVTLSRGVTYFLSQINRQ